MSNVLAVLAVLARVLMGFSLAFVVPLLWALVQDGEYLVRVWALAAGCTALAGWGLWLGTRLHRRELQPKDGFLLVNLVWTVLPAFGALPLSVVSASTCSPLNFAFSTKASVSFI